MTRNTANPLLRFLIPPVAVGAAHAATLLLWKYLENNLSMLFIVAVIISAVYGGVGPAVFASVLSALAAAFFYLPPRNSFDLGFDDFLRLLVFMIVSVFVSWLSAARRESEAALRAAHAELESRIEQRTAELSRVNEDLRTEINERVRAQNSILAYQGRLQALATDLSLTEERERRRIAAVLHDAVGHTLAVAVIRLRDLLSSKRGNGVTPELEDVCKLVEQSIQHTRSLTLDLSPPILYELGLEPAIEWLAERVQKQHWLTVSVKADSASKPMDDQVRALVFNAVRELLVNVVKHAQAKNVTVTIRRVEQAVEIVVKDDGIGFEHRQSAAPSGFGLFNIRERLVHLGGRFEVESSVGSGCTITLHAPLTAAKSVKAE
jgi:signal transduction histidine kinase